MRTIPKTMIGQSRSRYVYSIKQLQIKLIVQSSNLQQYHFSELFPWSFEIFHHMKVQKAEYESTFGVRAAVKSLQLGICKGEQGEGLDQGLYKQFHCFCAGIRNKSFMVHAQQLLGSNCKILPLQYILTSHMLYGCGSLSHETRWRSALCMRSFMQKSVARVRI